MQIAIGKLSDFFRTQRPGLRSALTPAQAGFVLGLLYGSLTEEAATRVLDAIESKLSMAKGLKPIRIVEQDLCELGLLETPARAPRRRPTRLAKKRQILFEAGWRVFVPQREKTPSLVLSELPPFVPVSSGSSRPKIEERWLHPGDLSAMKEYASTMTKYPSSPDYYSVELPSAWARYIREHG